MDPFTFVYIIYIEYIYLPIYLSTYPPIYLILSYRFYLSTYLSIYATFVLLASRAGPRVSPRRRVAQCGCVAGWQVLGDRRGGWAGRAGSRGGPGDGESRNGGLNDGDMWFNYVFHGGKRG